MASAKNRAMGLTSVLPTHGCQLPRLSGKEPVRAREETRPVKRGAVYTRPWVVDLLLDLADYTQDRDLADAIAVEPAAGNGTFLAEMVRRLALSCQQHGRPLSDMRNALIAFDIDPTAVVCAREAVVAALTTAPEVAFSHDEAVALAEELVQSGDYLCAASSLPSTDFVVGNPPYVRLEDMDADSMARYRRDYPTMTGRADLYIAFYEAALRSLKPGGVCAFICADRWMHNQYGAGLRRLISSGSFQVEAVLEMHEASAFEVEVNAYPSLTVIGRKTTQASFAPTVVARLSRENGQGNHSVKQIVSMLQDKPTIDILPSTNYPLLSVARVSPWFAGDEPWPRVSPEKLALLRRLEEDFSPLEDTGTGTKVGIGVATGLDRVFLTNDPTLVEPTCLLRLALTGDIQAGNTTLTWSGHYLVDPWHIQEPQDFVLYPRLFAYFAVYETALRARHIARNHPARWFRTIDRVDHHLTRQRKLYLPDIKGRITPVLDEGITYPHHNLYVVTSDRWDLEVLGGLLLSDIAQFFVECYAVRMRGGYLRFQAQYLRRIRVPPPDSLSPEQCGELITAFRTHDIARATATACSVYGIASLSAETDAASRNSL